MIRHVIKCTIATQQRLGAWWLQIQAPAVEDQVQIPEGAMFCLSCCHEIDDSKGMREGEGIKLCADGVGWNCENEGNVRPLGEKRLCSPECREDCIYFPCCYF